MSLVSYHPEPRILSLPKGSLCIRRGVLRQAQNAIASSQSALLAMTDQAIFIPKRYTTRYSTKMTSAHTSCIIDLLLGVGHSGLLNPSTIGRCDYLYHPSAYDHRASGLWSEFRASGNQSLPIPARTRQYWISRAASVHHQTKVSILGRKSVTNAL
jgi:hypothetical protein